MSKDKKVLEYFEKEEIKRLMKILDFCTTQLHQKSYKDDSYCSRIIAENQNKHDELYAKLEDLL